MSDVTIPYRFVVKRDTAANFTTANTLLKEGEWALELDTGKFKMGDGATAWNSLPYVTSDKIPEGLSNLYFTNARVYAANKVQLVAGSNVTVTADDVAGTLTIASTASGGGGGSGTEPDHPSVIFGADLVCCVDPRTLTSAVDGDLIDLVADSGAAGNNFTSSGTARPVFLRAGIAGQPSLLCSGSQTLAAASALIPANAQCTIGCVFTSVSADVIGTVLGQYVAGQAGRLLFSANQSSSGGASAGRFNPFIASATAGAGTSGLPADGAFTEPSVFTLANSGAAEGAKVAMNGRNFDSFTCSSVYAGVATVYGGYTGMAAGAGLDGMLGPLVIVNRVATSVELYKLQSWLRYYARR